ncbi:MAG TPA: indolepyruvate oxidoreductase subunit beta [Dehalococcoidales bacterium]|nr:indolepyruvate oxidoreductase subunit beta [Dehalococcoidales bacterium]
MAKKKEINIIICGVGGQGVVLVSELLGSAAVRGGVAVKGSEVLGMAQRGGSVFSNLRLGGDVIAPMTPEGKCDVLIAVEPSEALRNIQYLAKNSVVVLNTTTVLPYTVYLGKSGYPSREEIVTKLHEVTDRVITLDASGIAQQAGSLQAANVVMLGALFGTGLMPIKEETAKEAILSRFKAKVGEINIKAFDLGYEKVREALKAAMAKE